jgi:hypothetical protein
VKLVKNVCPQKVCIWRFRSVIFRTGKNWKQPVGKWINQPWYICKILSYSTKKTNEWSSSEQSWKNTPCSGLRTSTKNDFSYMTWHSGHSKTMEAINFSDCHWKGPRMRRWSSDYVQGRETNAEDTVVVDAWRHVFGRNHMTVQQKLNTKPWILDNNNISILPTSLKKYTTLLYTVNNTGKWWGWGGRTVVKKCCHFCLFFLILHQK